MLIAMGGMRLSTERDRDETRAIAVLHAAFDAGINFHRHRGRLLLG